MVSEVFTQKFSGGINYTQGGREGTLDCKLYWYPKLCFGSVKGSDRLSVVELIKHREGRRGYLTVNYTGTQSYALVQ